MSNPFANTIHITKRSNTKYTIQKTKMVCSNNPITNQGNQELAHWVHNSQYENKQTYTIHSTKTNKHA
jgi:hypothetical protein